MIGKTAMRWVLGLALVAAIAFTLAWRDRFDAAAQQGWTAVADAPGEGRVEATVRSLLYEFTDEVIVRGKAADGGSRVDVRSRSRIGRIDRSVNARRTRAWLAARRASAPANGPQP